MRAHIKSTTWIVIGCLTLALFGCGDTEVTPSARPASARTGNAHDEPAHDEPAHGEPAHGEPAHGEPAHDEPAHDEPAHDEPAHESEGPHVQLTPAQIQAAGIATAQAGPATLREQLPLYGVITPNAERVRDVTARFPGPIRTVTKRVGDRVSQGEVLATVESNESLQTYSVVAPLAGVITSRNANPGEQASDKPLFTVADLSTVWVELSLFPRDIAKVRVGQAVRVKSSDAHLTADGKVVYVAPFSSTSNQTLSARVLLDNREQKWPPGLYVSAEVTLGTTLVPLAISTQALQTLEDRNVVFIQNEHGFESRAVQLGRTDGDATEVLAGLSAGDRYATRNSFILKAELGKREAEHDH